MKISKFKKIFEKGYTSDWSKKVYSIKKIKKCCIAEILNRRPPQLKIDETFYETESQKSKPNRIQSGKGNKQKQ